MGTPKQGRAATRHPPTAAEVAPPAAIAGEVMAAVTAFEGFLADRDPAAPLTILCHSDADGLASGAATPVSRRSPPGAARTPGIRGCASAWPPRPPPC